MTKKPTVEYLDSLAVAFDITPAGLLGGDKFPPIAKRSLDLSVRDPRSTSDNEKSNGLKAQIDERETGQRGDLRGVLQGGIRQTALAWRYV